MRRIFFVLFSLSAPGICAAQARLPLPVPFLPIRGATPVPGNGAGISVDLGSGLLGPELSRGNMFGASVSFGWRDLFTVSIGNPSSLDQVTGRAKAQLQQLRLKAAILAPRGLRPAVAVSLARSWGDLRLSTRTTPRGANIDTLQDDHVGIWEFALPAEVLIKKHGKVGQTSVFAGPRLAFSRYDDRLQTDTPFGAVLPGAVAGIHLSAYVLELFLESTLVYVPQHSYAGGAFGGRVAIMPAIGGTFRIGPAFGWGKKKEK